MAGTASGTLLTIFANIHSEDIIKTAVLACIGAVVSFVISIGLKWIARKMQRKSSS
jgi:predicted permease